MNSKFFMLRVLRNNSR